MSRHTRFIASKINRNNPRNATNVVQAEITAVAGRTISVTLNGTAISEIAVLDHVNLTSVVGSSAWILDLGKGRWIVVGISGSL